jgi:thioesterase domain-containing protein
MTDTSTPIVILPGAGGIEEIDAFRAEIERVTPFETVCYPTWRHHQAGAFQGWHLVEQLAAQITEWVPHGPIRIVGYSIGGHLGYATGLHLQARGREISGLCAIDPFMNSRAFTKGWQLIREMKFGELIRLSTLKFRRMLLRTANGGLIKRTRRSDPSDTSPSIWGLNSDSRAEANMLLWLRDAAAWIASLDREPIALRAPAILLRTPLFAVDDPIWQRRCLNIAIHEVSGQHLTLFGPDNIGSLRDAFVGATRDWR